MIFFSSAVTRFSVSDFFLVYLYYFVLVKFTKIKSEYRYFVYSVLIFLVVIQLGWLGYILNFLIVSILYSTIVVIFFMFTIHIEDQARKKETRGIRGLPYFAITFFLEGADSNVVAEGLVRYTVFTENFLAEPSSTEFLSIYTAMYLMHWFSLYFFFFFMIGGCFAIVATLDLNKIAKIRASAPNAAGQLASSGATIRGATKTGFFFSASFVGSFRSS